MNTTALKSFAPGVRLQLIEAVTRKLGYVLVADTPALPLAQKRLDLDDGVKTNYLKFPDALAPIAGMNANDED